MKMSWCFLSDNIVVSIMKYVYFHVNIVDALWSSFPWNPIFEEYKSKKMTAGFQFFAVPTLFSPNFG